jgi:hypothetical protein
LHDTRFNLKKRVCTLALFGRRKNTSRSRSDERIDDLDEYKQKHGHLSVKKHEDNNLHHFCADVRHSLKQVEKDGTRKLTEERIKRLADLGFEW